MIYTRKNGRISDVGLGAVIMRDHTVFDVIGPSDRRGGGGASITGHANVIPREIFLYYVHYNYQQLSFST